MRDLAPKAQEGVLTLPTQALSNEQQGGGRVQATGRGKEREGCTMKQESRVCLILANHLQVPALRRVDLQQAKSEMMGDQCKEDILQFECV
jgi:hypothetical protein